uniref:receptor protein-tyrosine kinase n=1 Tax=Seriola dumerili TaxID=41447 RepID=A0A3B4U4R0_SERDU
CETISGLLLAMLILWQRTETAPLPLPSCFPVTYWTSTSCTGELGWVANPTEGRGKVLTFPFGTYQVCNVMEPNQNNCSARTGIPGVVPRRVYIEIKFTLRDCNSLPGVIGNLQGNLQPFYYYESNNDKELSVNNFLPFTHFLFYPPSLYFFPSFFLLRPLRWLVFVSLSLVAAAGSGLNNEITFTAGREAAHRNISTRHFSHKHTCRRVHAHRNT